MTDGPEPEFEEHECYIFVDEPKKSQNHQPSETENARVQLCGTNPTNLSEELDVHTHPPESTSVCPPEPQTTTTTNDTEEATNFQLSISTTPTNDAHFRATTSACPPESQTTPDTNILPEVIDRQHDV